MLVLNTWVSNFKRVQIMHIYYLHVFVGVLHNTNMLTTVNFQFSLCVSFVSDELVLWTYLLNIILLSPIVNIGELKLQEVK